MAFQNPTTPGLITAAQVLAQTPAAPAVFGPFKMDPTDAGAVFSLCGNPNYTGAVIVMEESADSGVLDLWGPVAGVRASNFSMDSFEGSGLALLDNQAYRWGVYGIIRGSYLRLRVPTLTSGTLKISRVSSGDTPFGHALVLAGAAKADLEARLLLAELWRVRMALQESTNQDLDKTVTLADVNALVAQGG
jgi:hypothetical protein